jgi:hypothetical protein
MDYEVEKRLEAFISGKFREPAFIEELCAVCASTPDFTWDVLAITDQYYRRGKISADLSRTIRHAIERPALAREVAGFAATTPMAQVAPIVPVAPAPVAQAALVAAPDELHALRDGLHASRQKLLRYRTRLTKLAAFAHKHRHALAEARREFESSRVHALAAFVPGPHTAMDLAPPDRGAMSGVGTDRDRAPRASRWVRQSQLVAAITMFLTVTASSALRETPIAGVAPIMAISAKAAIALASATPALPVVQQLSLDSERYVIRPGGRQALIRVQRTGGVTGKVSFTWWTSPSGAKSGADYQGRRPAVEQLPEGVDALTLSVPILANPLRSHTELFYVAIGHPGGGAVIGAIRASVIIIMPKS